MWVYHKYITYPTRTMTIDQLLASPEFVARRQKADQNFKAIEIKRDTNRAIYGLLRNDVRSFLDN